VGGRLGGRERGHQKEIPQKTNRSKSRGESFIDRKDQKKTGEVISTKPSQVKEASAAKKDRGKAGIPEVAMAW